MLNHLSLAVTDLARSATFYDATLLPLGYIRVWTDDTAVGYGPPGSDDKFAIKLRKNISIPGNGFHVAFTAPSHEAMHAFYEAALAHGGKDYGGAGLHSEYGPQYHAAFVIDPDGYRIEAKVDLKS